MDKCDQPKQGVVNTPAKMDDYVKEHGFTGWFETSAKENINIEEAARALVNKARFSAYLFYFYFLFLLPNFLHLMSF